MLHPGLPQPRRRAPRRTSPYTWPHEDFTSLAFSEVLFQGAKSTFKPLDRTTLLLAFDYHEKVSVEPVEEECPSDAQLSGLQARLS